MVDLSHLDPPATQIQIPSSQPRNSPRGALVDDPSSSKINKPSLQPSGSPRGSLVSHNVRSATPGSSSFNTNDKREHYDTRPARSKSLGEATPVRRLAASLPTDSPSQLDPRGSVPGMIYMSAEKLAATHSSSQLVLGALNLSLTEKQGRALPTVTRTLVPRAQTRPDGWQQADALVTNTGDPRSSTMDPPHEAVNTPRPSPPGGVERDRSLLLDQARGVDTLSNPQLIELVKKLANQQVNQADKTSTQINDERSRTQPRGSPSPMVGIKRLAKRKTSPPPQSRVQDRRMRSPPPHCRIQGESWEETHSNARAKLAQLARAGSNPRPPTALQEQPPPPTGQVGTRGSQDILYNIVQQQLATHGPIKKAQSAPGCRSSLPQRSHDLAPPEDRRSITITGRGGIQVQLPADLPQAQLLEAIQQVLHGEPDPSEEEEDEEDVEESASILSDREEGEISEEDGPPPKRPKLPGNVWADESAVGDMFGKMLASFISANLGLHTENPMQMLMKKSPAKSVRIPTAPTHFLERTIDELQGIDSSLDPTSRTELRTLQSEVLKEKIDSRKTRMEELANTARVFMMAPKRRADARWADCQSRSGEKPGDDEMEVDGSVQKAPSDGLPILKDHIVRLAKLMLTKKAPVRSSLATTVRVRDDHYRNCCQFSTTVSDQECQALGSLTGKGPEEIKKIIEKDRPEDWSAAVTACDTPRTTLKLAMTTGAACDAAREANEESVSLLDSAYSHAQRALDAMAVLGPTGEAIPEIAAACQAIRTTQAELAGARRRCRVAAASASYAGGAALAATDASARGLRAGLERCRIHCARAMFRLRVRAGKKGGSSAIEQAMLALPYLPGSLFGGRLPHALQRLYEQQESVTSLGKLVASIGGRMPQLDIPPLRQNNYQNQCRNNNNNNNQCYNNNKKRKRGGRGQGFRQGAGSWGQGGNPGNQGRRQGGANANAGNAKDGNTNTGQGKNTRKNRKFKQGNKGSGGPQKKGNGGNSGDATGTGGQ